MKRITLLFVLLMSATAQIQAKDAVVLLHGLCRSSSSMEKMEARLTEEGYFVLNIDYPSRTASIEELADLAIGETLKNPKLEEIEKVHFVTHSLGGILVRSYFKRNEYSKLGRVVMLGPPNQGSEVVSRLGSMWAFGKVNGPAGDELGIEDDSTPNQLGPVNFELGVIAGDRSINWFNSHLIEGPDDGKVSVERTKVEGMKEHITIHVTHPYIMKRKKPIEHTVHFLETGSFQGSTND